MFALRKHLKNAPRSTEVAEISKVKFRTHHFLLTKTKMTLPQDIRFPVASVSAAAHVAQGQVSGSPYTCDTPTAAYGRNAQSSWKHAS